MEKRDFFEEINLDKNVIAEIDKTHHKMKLQVEHKINSQGLSMNGDVRHVSYKLKE